MPWPTSPTTAAGACLSWPWPRVARPTTLTSVLDRLERRGHITRGSRPGDRRAVLVELTPSSRQAAATIRQAITGLERRASAPCPPRQSRAYHAALQALTEATP